MKLKKTR